MARLTQSCPICQKPLVQTHTFSISDTQHVNTFKCGHMFVETKQAKRVLDFVAPGNPAFKARPYQEEGIEFIFDSDFNCVIGDQMRLGKTNQSLLALRNAYAERTPCLIIVKSANLWQWVREYKIWCDPLPSGIYPIIGTTSWIPPGFRSYVISMDTFSRQGPCATCKHVFHEDGPCKRRGCNCRIAIDGHDSMIDKLEAFGFKLIIADEAHSFKNTDSNRSTALTTFLRRVNETKYDEHHECPICQSRVNISDKTFYGSVYCVKCDKQVYPLRKQELSTRRKCGIIMLSGTSIKNKADEYFVPLNIVAPHIFPSLKAFRSRWLDADGKRIMPYRMDQFKDAIKPYVLRREKEDVYTDLPKLNRMFTVITVDDERLKKAYNKVLDKIELEMTSRSNYTFFDSIGDLMILRQICGLAKVPFVTDYAEESLLDSDKSRLAIGIHHHAVRDALAFNLSHLGVLKLSGEDSSEKKDYIMRYFADSPERILVINMLAGGVGMDFHYCHNALILERQWSSADEEQFEFRFYNPDRSIMGDNQTNIEYIIAKGTIDEWFYDMVEQKRVIFGETISTQWDMTKDAGSFRQLIEQTVSHRL